MKLRKLFAIGFAALSICAVASISVNAENDVVSVSVDNTMVTFEDQTPVIIEGHTLVPARAVFEQVGATVEWDQPTQTATIKKDNYTVAVTYQSNIMYKNGEAIELEQPADIIENRIMLPVRAISEAMDFAVTWDGHHSLILISTTGKPYRPYAFLKTGFRTLEDQAEFYSNGSALDNIDLDGDGKAELISFASSMDILSDPTPVLEINGIDYTAGLGSLTSVYSIAVIDIDKTDSTKEIVITENGDTLTARFYRYENGILKTLANKDGEASTVPYASTLLLSGTGYLLSDLTGVCFTDVMVTGCVYRLDTDEIGLYQMTKIDTIFGRNLYNTYSDNMLYNITYTMSYQPGSYKDATDVGVIYSSSLTQFKLIDGYKDESDPRYIELYIELPTGEKAVITPYQT